MGRVTRFSPKKEQETVDSILDGVRRGKSVKDAIAQAKHKRSSAWFYTHLAKNEPLQHQFTTAKTHGALARLEGLTRASQALANWAMKKIAADQVDSVVIAALRMHAQDVQWQTSRLLPKQYGNKMSVESAGAGPVTIKVDLTGEDE